MIFKGTLRLTAVLGVPLAALCQMASRTAPIPNDPLEMVTGSIQMLDTPESRNAAVEALTRARGSDSLKAAGVGYHLTVSFKVNSGGLTAYDGDWQMEETHIPSQGTNWTAKATAGYSTTQIEAGNEFYGDAAGSTIPLRLHEARAAVFGAIGTNVTSQQLIRSSTATYNGIPVTCYLYGGAGIAMTETPGRRWDEAEDCIDPQTGLLQVHSVVPGRYYAYDYTDAPRLGSRVLPRKVTVTEAGQIVSVIRVDSLSELATADPSLFVPTAEMKARGQSVAMTGSTTFSVFPAGTPGPDATIHPVCVFGVVSPEGQIVEAHSLQPSDPNSQAAVDAAKATRFSPSNPDSRPAQHFAFLIERFPAPASNR